MIKFVYFDLGGVVINDFSKNNKWEVMKKVMGVKPSFEKEFDEFYDKYEHEDVCLTRPVDTLIPILEEKFDMKFPKEFSMNQYFIDHFDKNSFIEPVIKEINIKSKIGILSNQYVDMFEGIQKKNILPKVKWDVVVDSTKVLLQKPDPKIFEYATNKAGVLKQEILFVDNSQKNIDAGIKFGWQTFLYNSANHKKSSEELLTFYRSFG